MNKTDNDAGRKIKQVSIWLSEKESRLLKIKSEELGTTQSGYLRKCINEEIAFLDDNLKKVARLFILTEKR